MKMAARGRCPRPGSAGGRSPPGRRRRTSPGPPGARLHSVVPHAVVTEGPLPGPGHAGDYAVVCDEVGHGELAHLGLEFDHGRRGRRAAPSGGTRGAASFQACQQAPCGRRWWQAVGRRGRAPVLPTVCRPPSPSRAMPAPARHRRRMP